jgi:hypothetical protein
MNPPPHENDPPAAPENEAAPIDTSGIDHQNWSSAPEAVRFAHGLAYAGALFCAIVFIYGIMLMGQPFGLIGGLFYAFAGAMFLLTNLWLIPALRSGKPEAWGLQQCLSILGLFVCCLGTVPHGYLLLKWNQPETKAWFGKRDRSQNFPGS